MIFLGYDDESKAYRCYDPVKEKLVISRDVRFVEKQENVELYLLDSEDDLNNVETYPVSTGRSNEVNVENLTAEASPTIN